MSDKQRGQVRRSAAEIYEEFYLPAIFEQWPPHLAVRAGIRNGQTVLDVACGSGVLARHAAGLVEPEGSVVGLDLNESMLDVARKKAPSIQWTLGRAEALPFADEHFDAVLSQFGLMFFEDRPKALREMQRVLKPGGMLVVAVWDQLENSPGYRELTDLLEDRFGASAGEAFRSPFNMGDTALLRDLLSEAGMGSAHLETLEGQVNFNSFKDWMYADVYGWTMDQISEEEFNRFREATRPALSQYIGPDGSVQFPSPAHVFHWRKEA